MQQSRYIINYLCHNVAMPTSCMCISKAEGMDITLFGGKIHSSMYRIDSETQLLLQWKLLLTDRDLTLVGEKFLARS